VIDINTRGRWRPGQGQMRSGNREGFLSLRNVTETPESMQQEIKSMETDVIARYEKKKGIQGGERVAAGNT